MGPGLYDQPCTINKFTETYLGTVLSSTISGGSRHDKCSYEINVIVSGNLTTVYDFVDEFTVRHSKSMTYILSISYLEGIPRAYHCNIWFNVYKEYVVPPLRQLLRMCGFLSCTLLFENHLLLFVIIQMFHLSGKTAERTWTLSNIE